MGIVEGMACDIRAQPGAEPQHSSYLEIAHVDEFQKWNYYKTKYNICELYETNIIANSNDEREEKHNRV